MTHAIQRAFHLADREHWPRISVRLVRDSDPLRGVGSGFVIVLDLANCQKLRLWREIEQAVKHAESKGARIIRLEF